MNVVFDAQWSRWPWLVVIAVLLLLAGGFLRKSGRLTLLQRGSLTAMRIGALGLLAILILSPVLQVRWMSRQRPRLAVAVDLSRSMLTRDSAGDRFRTVLSALETPDWADELKNNGIDLHWYGFDGAAKRVDPSQLDSASFHGSPTNGSELFERIARDLPPPRLSGILLFSDGVFNTGKDAVSAAARLGIPVFTVAIGDTVEPPDLYISGIRCPATGVEKVPMEVTVLVGGKGGIRGKAWVELRDGKKILKRKPVRIQTHGGIHSVRLHPIPDKTGRRQWEFRISGIGSESNLQNNHRVRSLRITQSKIRIAAAFGSPNPDARFLRLAMASDPALRCTSFVAAHKSEKGFGGASLFLRDALQADPDVVLIQGIPLDNLGEDLLKRLRQFVRAGHGLILLGITRATPGLPFLNWLPGSAGPSPRVPAPMAQVGLSSWARASALMEGPAQTNIGWDRFPPVPWYPLQKDVGMRPLVFFRHDGDSVPVIQWKRLGKGKVLLSSLSSMWKWHFRPSQESELGMGVLWPGWIRWMATTESDRPFLAYPARSTYRHGEETRLIAEVNDPGGRPISNAEVSVEIASPAGVPQQYRLVASGELPGVYEISLPVEAPGRYTFTCHAERMGGKLGIQRGSFRVVPDPIEAQRMATDALRLRKMALRTRGKYYTVADFAKNIGHDLKAAPLLIPRTRRIRVGRSPLLFAGMVILLLAEWMLRKKWHLE